MLPAHHLPQLIPTRIHMALHRMQGQYWQNPHPVIVEASSPRQEQCPLEEGKKLPLEAVKPCTYWGKLFDQRWCKVTLPHVSTDNTWLHWIDQGEATLYIDEVPYFGFNVAHRYCRLPEGVSEVWLQSSCVQSAVWHPEANGMKAEGSFFEKAFVCERNDEIWHAYHDLKCLLDVAIDITTGEHPMKPSALGAFGLKPILDKSSPIYRILLAKLDQAVDLLELEGFASMRAFLAEVYEELKHDKVFSKCILTGHAHLDLVWMWPERIGELKAVNVFATMNHHMQHYPEFRFAYSQPASYEAVERREPALMQQVKKRIGSGQWEATGAMYVESDTVFACGEALARSFMVGQDGFAELTGKPAKLTWLPDVFGYAACLPQIMKQTGVEYFFTTKMTWNAVNRFPYSSFIWRGNDGSEILAHVTQESGYVTHMEVRNVKNPMEGNQQAAIHPEYLLPTGYGDGGGGVTDAMMERARRLSALPDMPSIQWDQPTAFFDRLNTVRDQLPVHQGECYLEYHRGTYTTHSNLKWSFRNLERALQVAEAVDAATGQRHDLTHAWKRQVFAQFHDYIPGSSVWDVYKEGLPELNAIADTITQDAQSSLGNSGESCLFNPHAVTVKRWVDTESGAPTYVALPPLSGTSLADAQVESPEAVQLNGHTVSNGLVSATFNKDGWIDELTWEGLTLPQRAPLGQLVLYPDHAAHFESWDIDRHVLSMGEVCDAKPSVEAIVEGPHRAGFSVTRKVGKKSSATVRFLIEAGSPLVHISIELDWQEPESLLKLYFPTKYAATNARFGIAYGSVLRPQVSSGMTAEAMWEVPFGRHMAVFDEGEREGLCVMTQSKYGATVRDGQVGISLVRSPRVTGMDVHGNAWPRHLSKYKDESPYSDMGQQTIDLAIGHYDMSLPSERQPASLADTLFTSPVSYQGAPIAPVIQSLESGPTLVPCWAKPTKDGAWILRLQETSGLRGKASLSLADGWTCELTQLDESTSQPIDGSFAYSPYEIISIRVAKA